MYDSLPCPALSVEDYLALCDEAISAGREPPAPETREQLLTLADRYPQYAYLYWPSPRDCRALDIDHRHRQRTDPLPSRLRDRLAADIAARPEYWRPVLLSVLSD